MLSVQNDFKALESKHAAEKQQLRESFDQEKEQFHSRATENFAEILRQSICSMC